MLQPLFRRRAGEGLGTLMAQRKIVTAMKFGVYRLAMVIATLVVPGNAVRAEVGMVVRVADIAVNETSNGATIQAASGQVIDLTLNSMYWQVDGSSNRAVVVENAAPLGIPAPIGACPPGVGCGTIRMSFTARERGTARISASRTICGEDLPCKPDQRTFTITVIVR